MYLIATPCREERDRSRPRRRTDRSYTPPCKVRRRAEREEETRKHHVHDWSSTMGWQNSANPPFVPQNPHAIRTDELHAHATSTVPSSTSFSQSTKPGRLLHPNPLLPMIPDQDASSFRPSPAIPHVALRNTYSEAFVAWTQEVVKRKTDKGSRPTYKSIAS